MSSVEVDSTLGMVVEQAATAAASAIVTASGVQGVVEPSVPCTVDEVHVGEDVVFVAQFGATTAGLVVSSALAEAFAGDADGEAASTALVSLVEVGARASEERINGIADGLGAFATVSRAEAGLGSLASGTAHRVSFQIDGIPSAWIMWIASPELEGSLSVRGSNAAVIDAIDYPDLGPGTQPSGEGADISFLSDVTMGVSVELGRTVMKVRDVLQLTQGSVIELDRAAGALVDVLISGSLIARGEVVVIDDQLGVRVVEIIDTSSPPR